MTKTSRGFGYVIFRSPEDVNKAMQMNGMLKIDGRAVRINAATSTN
jgi:RNA recognition motif-containing protein